MKQEYEVSQYKSQFALCFNDYDKLSVYSSFSSTISFLMGFNFSLALAVVG